MKKFAVRVLFRKVNPYSYVCTYKSSQDHVELCNSSIRARGGNNNNPDALQLKSAMKKILLRAEVTASRYANCLSLDADDSPPIFTLKWTKNRTALISEKDDSEAFHVDMNILDAPIIISEHKENAIAYISGYIVRKLTSALECDICCDAMIESDKQKRHLSLIAIKDNGGLVYPSEDVVQVVRVCEKYFKLFVCGEDMVKVNSSKNLRLKLTNTIINELRYTRPGKVLFECLLDHDLDYYQVTEDFHSTQVMKGIVQKYVSMRLLRYGQEYTMNVIKAKSLGKRQKMNKAVLFDGL